MKRTLRISLITTFALLAPTAPAQELLWTRQVGSSQNDEVEGIAVDGAGNAYIAGRTLGDFGGHSFGERDAFLTKYDASGVLLWSRQPGTSENDFSDAVAVDDAGNVYITGSTDGNLGGPSAGGYDFFLSKYDPSGTVLWTRQGGTPENDHSTAVAVDGAGNAYIAGFTYGNLGGPNPNPRYYDIFLAKYDASGTPLWTRQAGTSGSDRAWAVTVDKAGNVFMTGWTTGSLAAPHVGSWDTILAKYAASGELLWMRQIGTSGNDHTWSVAVDNDGNAYISGDSQGALAGPFIGGVKDAFLIKYDGDGAMLWSRQIGSTANDFSNDVAVDSAGNAFIVGKTQGSFAGPLAGLNDIIVAKYDASGTPLWAYQTGTPVDDYGQAVAVDESGNAYVASHTWGGLSAPSAGGADIHLAKFADSCYPDCDKSTGNGVLDVFDFLCWQDDFVTGNSYACDCDTSTGQLVCDVFDFLCFQDAFVGGCP